MRHSRSVTGPLWVCAATDPTQETHPVRVALGLLAILVVSILLLWYSLGKGRPVPVDTRFADGTHLVFLFIAPTGDGSDSLRAVVHRMRESFRDSARTLGFHYTTLAVADDWDVNKAIDKLRRFGPFDEIDVGRNGLNLGLRRHVFDEDGPRVVPQVILAVERIEMNRHRSPVLPSVIVRRLVGVSEILAWKDWRGDRAL